MIKSQNRKSKDKKTHPAKATNQPHSAHKSQDPASAPNLTDTLYAAQKTTQKLQNNGER